MLFRTTPGGVLSISQPMHAWVSGQILRAWAERPAEPVLLAAEQHDIGWLDWETAPSFDPATGRPHLFRHVGPSLHAPMWARGVERVRAAWGRHAALLVSRHGSVIYTRFTDRSLLPPDDAGAITHYLDTQATARAGWAAALGLDAGTVAHQAELVALSDTLSLLMCGELHGPLTLVAPGGHRFLADGAPASEDGGSYTLHPWPFHAEHLVFEIEARPLPPEGRFADAAAMQAWHAADARVSLRLTLSPGVAGGEAPERRFPKP